MGGRAGGEESGSSGSIRLMEEIWAQPRTGNCPIGSPLDSRSHLCCDAPAALRLPNCILRVASGSSQLLLRANNCDSCLDEARHLLAGQGLHHSALITRTRVEINPRSTSWTVNTGRGRLPL